MVAQLVDRRDRLIGLFKKRGLDVRQTKRMVWVCEGDCTGHSPGDEPLTLMRCHSYMKPMGESLSVAEPTT